MPRGAARAPGPRQEGTLRRTPVFIALFALAVALTAGGSSWLAWRGTRIALERDFETELRRVAATAAAEIGPLDAREALRGDEGALLAMQVQLTTMRAALGLENASFVDARGITRVDARGGSATEGRPSVLDSLAGASLARALAGEPQVSGAWRRGGRAFRAAFAPVRGDSGVVAVVAVEAAANYVRAVEELGRTLTLVALGTLVAIALLAGLVIRGARSAAALERRLSSAENLAAMGRLTAVLAHEIKNPLAIIRGSAQRLGRLEPEAERMARYVVEEVDRLSRTVTRYLQFARGAAGAAPPGEGGDAIAALESTLGLLEGEIASRGLALDRDGVPAGLVAPVRLDNESLQQVYLNLVLNALDASPPGGVITVATVAHGGRWEVTVADRGAGFPPEVLRQLGAPFLTTRPEGSGLGLFLARRLVEGAGGSLAAHNAATGAVVRVRLPRRQEG